jgi:hypothetical protein
VINDLPPQAQVGGTPARAFRAWLRGEAWLAREAGRRHRHDGTGVKPANG